jgi:hypothetical protein
VTTPDHFDPPGVYTTPNPDNEYGLVKPFDVVDFYVSPAIYAETQSILSYAEINFSAVDVPFVTVSFEEGYLL